MDIKHVLSLNPLQPAYAGRPADTADPGPLGWVDFDGGLVEIGHRGEAFSFDNELPLHQQWLPPFRLADRLITNGDWLAFIADGGYRRPEFWLSDGWARVQAEEWEAPFYWTQIDGVWFEHTLHGTWPLNPSLPVCHISHYEADAYAAAVRGPHPARDQHERDDQRPAGGHRRQHRRQHAAAHSTRGLLLQAAHESGPHRHGQPDRVHQRPARRAGR